MINVSWLIFIFIYIYLCNLGIVIFGSAVVDRIWMWSWISSWYSWSPGTQPPLNSLPCRRRNTNNIIAIEKFLFEVNHILVNVDTVKILKKKMHSIRSWSKREDPVRNSTVTLLNEGWKTMVANINLYSWNL